jgi:RNA chaperone Hfq
MNSRATKPRRALKPEVRERLAGKRDDEREGQSNKSVTENRYELQWFNSALNNDVVVKLMNGEVLRGRLKAFARYTIRLDIDGDDTLLFKHALLSLQVAE